MKKFKLFFLFIVISIFLNIWSWYASDVCDNNPKPVCGAVTTTCVSGKCNYFARTYVNSCHLADSRAQFLYDGVCNTAKSTSYIKDLQNNTDNTSNTISTLSSNTVSTSPITSSSSSSISSSSSSSSSKFSPTFVNDDISRMRGIVWTKVQNMEKSQQISFLQSFTSDLQKKYNDGDQKNKTIQNYWELVKVINQYLNFVSGNQPSNVSPTNVTSSANTNPASSSTTTRKFTSLGINIQMPSNYNTSVDSGWSLIIQAWSDQIIISKISLAVILNLSPLNFTSTANSWTDLYLLFNNYIRDNFCVREFGWQRTLTYKILESDMKYSNATDYSMMFVCQEWSTDSTPQSLKLMSSPLKLSVGQKDWVYYILWYKKPQIWAKYTQDVRSIFSTNMQKIFLGEDISTYNSVVDELLAENKSILDKMWK